MEIYLLPTDLQWARQVGKARHQNAISSGRQDAHGLQADYRQGLDTHIAGAAAELAYCRASGIEWPATIDTYKEEADVGRHLEIRWTEKGQHSLIIRPSDPLDRYYVLVTGKPPAFRVVGYIWGEDAIRDEWRRAPKGRPPAWFVPQSALEKI